MISFFSWAPVVNYIVLNTEIKTPHGRFVLCSGRRLNRIFVFNPIVAPVTEERRTSLNIDLKWNLLNY